MPLWGHIATGDDESGGSWLRNPALDIPGQQHVSMCKDAADMHACVSFHEICCAILTLYLILFKIPNSYGTWKNCSLSRVKHLDSPGGAGRYQIFNHIWVLILQEIHLSLSLYIIYIYIIYIYLQYYIYNSERERVVRISVSFSRCPLTTIHWDHVVFCVFPKLDFFNRNFRCLKSHHITSKLVRSDPNQGVKLTWLWLKCDSKSKPPEVEICGLARGGCGALIVFFGVILWGFFFVFWDFMVIDRDLTSKLGMWMRFTRNWRVCDWQCPFSSMTLHGDFPVRTV